MLSYRIFTLVATVSRLMQWTSSVIVLGIVAWFMAHYEHDPHNVYQLVIVCCMCSLFVPPFSSSPLLLCHDSKLVAVFSYAVD